MPVEQAAEKTTGGANRRPAQDDDQALDLVTKDFLFFGIPQAVL